jgi:hypothetical protein
MRARGIELRAWISPHPFKPSMAMSARRIIRRPGQREHETLGKSVKDQLPQGRITRRTGFELNSRGRLMGEANLPAPTTTPEVERCPGQDGYETPLNREEAGLWERNGGRRRFADGAPPSPGVLPFPGRPRHHPPPPESSDRGKLAVCLASPGTTRSKAVPNRIGVDRERREPVNGPRRLFQK